MTQPKLIRAGRAGEGLVTLSIQPYLMHAGRAGRFGGSYEEGLVTCLNAADIPYLEECLAATLEPATTAGITASLDQLKDFKRSAPPYLILSDPATLLSHL